MLDASRPSVSSPVSPPACRWGFRDQVTKAASGPREPRRTSFPSTRRSKFLYHVPAKTPPTGIGTSVTLPLVIVLHGSNGDAEAVRHASRFDSLADANGFRRVRERHTRTLWTVPLRLERRQVAAARRGVSTWTTLGSFARSSTTWRYMRLSTGDAYMSPGFPMVAGWRITLHARAPTRSRRSAWSPEVFSTHSASRAAR